MGRQRTNWIVRNFWQVQKKLGPNQKLSSEVFESDDFWYLDLYPNGYNIPEGERFCSLFLHSSKEQVEQGKILKQIFNLGVKVQKPDDRLKAMGYKVTLAPFVAGDDAPPVRRRAG